MKDNTHSLDILSGAAELRQLILDNPDLPILCFAGENANFGYYGWMACSCKAKKGEVLDCVQKYDEEHIFTDREEFEDTLRDYYDDFDGSEAEFDTFIDSKLAEYDSFWKPCIILYCDN